MSEKMYIQQSRTIERTAATLLLLSVVTVIIGAVMWGLRGGMKTDIPTNPPPSYALERGFIMAAVILAALGFVVLEERLEQAGGRVLARMGAATYLFGGVLLVVAEALELNQAHALTHNLTAVYVILALLAQAAIGGALLQSRLLPAWVGWATIAWNLLFLVVLPIASPGGIYYPVVHHVMPLVIGMALLRQ